MASYRKVKKHRWMCAKPILARVLYVEECMLFPTKEELLKSL